MSRNLAMIVAVLAAFLVGGFTTRFASAAITGDWVGTDWNEWSEVKKTFYVFGFRDGTSFAWNQALTVMDLSPDDPRAVQLMKQIAPRSSTAQIIAGIGSVYGDYRNLSLPLHEVATHVTLELGGYARKDNLEFLRRFYAAKGDK